MRYCRPWMVTLTWLIAAPRARSGCFPSRRQGAGRFRGSWSSSLRARAVAASRSEASLERSLPRALEPARRARSRRDRCRGGARAPLPGRRALRTAAWLRPRSRSRQSWPPHRAGRPPRPAPAAPPKSVKRQGFANETYVAPHGRVNARRSCGQNNVVDLSWIWRRSDESGTRAMAAAGSAALASRSRPLRNP
jgi:hypothetical protein